jgi:hypothetical protein
MTLCCLLLLTLHSAMPRPHLPLSPKIRYDGLCIGLCYLHFVFSLSQSSIPRRFLFPPPFAVSAPAFAIVARLPVPSPHSALPRHPCVPASDSLLLERLCHFAPAFIVAAPAFCFRLTSHRSRFRFFRSVLKSCRDFMTQRFPRASDPSVRLFLLC